MRQAGQRMTDAAIIDAYEKAYAVAQEVGSDGRKSEMPPMRDRQTMARRVRGYVTTSKNESYSSSSDAVQTTSAERKALATMGRRGGKKAAERWKTDPDGEYAQGRREALAAANRRKKASGNSTRAQILSTVSQAYEQTGKIPTWGRRRKRKKSYGKGGLSPVVTGSHTEPVCKRVHHRTSTFRTCIRVKLVPPPSRKTCPVIRPVKGRYMEH